MALVHDLVEIYAGDVYGGATDELRMGKEEREKASAEKLFSQLPDSLKDEFSNLWMDYEERLSNESQFVWALDKISPRFQLTITKRDAASDMPTNFEKVKAQEKRIEEISKSLGEVLRKIHEDRKDN